MRVQRMPSQLATSALSSRSPFPYFFLPSAFSHLSGGVCSVHVLVNTPWVFTAALDFLLNSCRGWGSTRPWRLVCDSPMKAGLIWSPEPPVIAICFRVILARVLLGDTYMLPICLVLDMGLSVDAD